MLDILYINPERASKIFPNMKKNRFEKFKKEFISLWEKGYYPRKSYIEELNGIELNAFIHYLSWRDYFNNENLIKEIELFQG